MTYQYRDTFKAVHETCDSTNGLPCAPLDGQPFTVLHVIEDGNEHHDPSAWDAEVLPVFLIEVAGERIHAWPEEVLVND